MSCVNCSLVMFWGGAKSGNDIGGQRNTNNKSSHRSGDGAVTLAVLITH